MRLASSAWAVGSFCVALSGCVLDRATPDESAGTAADAGTASEPMASVSLLTWNLDWFQDPTEGPADDAAQYTAVRDILASTDDTLIALEEVASEAAFERLLHDLPDYAGVLSGYAWTQKTALLWNRNRFTLQMVHAISGLEDAGRPPLLLSLQDSADGSSWLVVVIHAKAQADAKSHARRAELARGLKSYLDTEHAHATCVVLGDFNDRLNGSITTGAASPYAVFSDDPRYYDAAPDTTESSYSWGPSIDHVIVSNALAPPAYHASVNVLRDELLAEYPSFSTTVSDHFPVEVTLSRSAR